MTVQTIRDMLLWCSIINIAFLLWWFLFFTFAHDWVYRFHSKWFKVPVKNFDSIHYAGIAFYKICIFLFNIVPYIALHIVA
ncbi:MAG: DUF6868 family protein [Planctomycetota bacterium]